MHAAAAGMRFLQRMNQSQLTIRLLSLTAVFALPACTTVVEKKEPSVTSTTTTEETHHAPLRGSTSTQTTTTESR